MNAEIWIEIGSVAALVGFSFLISAAKTCFAAVSRARLAMQADAGVRTASAEWLFERRERLAGALRAGNILLPVLATVLAVRILLHLYGEAGAAYAIFAMAALMLLADFLARAWAAARPQRAVMLLTPFARFCLFAFGWLAAVAEWLARMCLRMSGIGAVGDEVPLSAHEELRDAAAALHRGGAFVKQDRDRIGGLLDLAELEVSDVMVHRTAMRSINADDPPDALVREILHSPHTRMPVWRGSTENIVGVVHAKDLLRELHDNDNDLSRIDIMKVARKPWFVPDTTTLRDQLNAFLRRKSHFAIVVDEYGEMEGLVTLEDIIEEIVGEIADEHDVDMQGVRQQPDGSVIVDGSIPIRDLNRALDWQLPDEEATTIAGLVIHEAQTIPEEKQAFTFHGKRFTVLKRERNRIMRLRIRAVQEV